MNDIVQTTIHNLNRNNMAGYYAHSVAQLHETIRTLIRKGETVGCGDSLTLEQTGIFDLMRCQEYKFLDKQDEAVLRARQTAAPLDAKRLGKSTPCTVLNNCIDCHHPQRICNDFVLITGQFEKDRIKVIFIEGIYGF